jgi:uncharacterized protein
MNEELPLVFRCEDDTLIGILHRTSVEKPRRGVVVVVAGGPQYRAGAHRQFVLLARKLAAHGFPALRFDLRGMGDSGGPHRGFEYSEADIRAAIDALEREVPDVTEVVVFGECESASGALFYAHKDPRVKGLVLVNPWVRTERGQAKTYLKHYYIHRIASKDFWRKVARFEFNPVTSLRSLAGVASKAWPGAGRRVGDGIDDRELRALPLPERTALVFRRFHGSVLVVLSGKDYIAREFDEATSSASTWRGLMDRNDVKRCDMTEADHTFSRRVWREQVSDALLSWLRSW